MNTEKIEKKLQKDLPDVVIKSHQDALRNLLLKEFERKNAKRHPLIFTKISHQGGEYIMQHKILTIGITGLAVVTLVVGIFVIGGSPLSPIKPAQAAAQELIDRSIDRIIKLSPEEQKDLEKKLNADLESSLQEARNAKDLEIVPENEIERFQMPTPGKERKMISTTFKKKAPIQNGDQPSLEEPTETVQRVIIKRTDQGESTDESTTVIDNPGPHVHFDGGKIPAPIGVTVLRYTNSEGGLVQLGIDKDDKPVFKLIKLDKEHKDGNKESNVLFLQKKDG